MSHHVHNIKGGVHPAFHKDESTQQSITDAAIPEKLMIPVRQHMGTYGRLIVNEGDYVYKGQPITDQPEGLGSITHSSTSGTITAVGKFPVPHISGYSCPGITLKPDGKEDWGEQRLTPYVDYQSLDDKILIDRIRDAGLVGMGGAAFPSAVKISGTAEYGLETLIINAAECEPYISCDDMLMRTHADEVIEGIHVLIHILKPKQCLVGIEDNKPEAIAAMQKVLQVKATGDQGKKAYYDKINIISIPTIYPSGDEKQLIRILTGKLLTKKELPFRQGLLVHNVATAHNIYKAVVKGEPLISRIVTVTGRGVKQPQNFYTLIGTSFKHMIEQAGGYTDKAERLIMGGPMMGFPMQTDDLPVVKVANCILVLPQEDLPYSTQLAMPCIRCGKCAQACPVDLLPQQLYWHARANDLEKVQQHHLFDCIECGCCTYVCPSHIPLVNYYRYAKSSVREEIESQKSIDTSRERHEFRELRQTRDKEERDAKRAKHKMALQKKKAVMAKKKAAESASTDDKSDAVDPIKAALKRAEAKKIKVENDPKQQPRNTKNLTASQQKQIEATNQSREKMAQATKKPLSSKIKEGR